jgi:OmpA-OmpF porin, OOP family
MKNLSFVLLLVISFTLIFIPVSAQIDIKRKVISKATNRADTRSDQAVDKGLDTVESGVKNVFKKKADNDQASQEDEKIDEQEQSQPMGEAKSSTPSQPSLQSYSKFDFMPGERIIFFDDFSQDAIGDFPAQWNTNGSAEVVTTNLFPGKWMQFIGDGSIWTDQLLNLPEDYTVEYDAIPIKGETGHMEGYHFRMIKSINTNSYDHGAVPGKAGFLFDTDYSGRQSYRAYNNEREGDRHDMTGYRNDDQYYQKENQLHHISIWVQKTRVRVYQDEIKLFDLPKAFLPPSSGFDRIRFEQGAAMISNIRIAIGAPDTRSKLITEGKLVSYGIYFDVNKDVVKPESYGSLKVIASVMQENPDIRIKIIGHTDSDGADDMNLDLSKRRGMSVKNELVKTFGIDGSRMESDGFGELQPVAENDTPAHKALNRRVEFIKL